MAKKWTYHKENRQQVEALQEVLGIRESLCEILLKRGVKNFEEARNFFRPKYDHLHNPFLMKDMQIAVDVILQAMHQKRKILIVGDYDVDGTTACAILMLFLKRIYDSDKFQYYIPDRYTEGYGVSNKAIHFALEADYQLIISLDCGIKANKQIEFAKRSGIDFIVCDHHLPGGLLPCANAILNPKQPGCKYPYKELSGCGVTFKLIKAIAIQLHMEVASLHCYLDLLMVSIAADIVPVTGENRSMAWLGLKHFNESPCVGLKALLDLQYEKKNYTLRDVAFGIAPAINAAGRMSDARIAVELFTTSDQEKAGQLASQLWELNAKRKETDAIITLEANEILAGKPDLPIRKSTVVFKENWHKGVVGIVASRLIESYYRPTIVLAIQDSIATGSARSVPGFNITEAIRSCEKYLITYGGHEAAAGLSLHLKDIEPFVKRFEEVVAGSIHEEHLTAEITIDTEIGFSDISAKYLSVIKQMEPFGPHNSNPVFITRRAKNTSWSKVVGEKHLRLVAEQSGVRFSGIGFGLAKKMKILEESSFIDILYTLDENIWNGKTSVQLKIIDIRPSVI